MRRVSTAAALVAGVVAALSVAPGGPLALALGLAGFGLLGVGTYRGRRREVTAGSALQFGGVLAAGVAGLPPGLAMFGALAAVVAWDAGTFGIELDEQLGPAAGTTGAEVVHVAATLVAGGAVGSLAYVAALAGTGRFPPLAAIAIVAGAWLLAMGLEPFADPERSSF